MKTLTAQQKAEYLKFPGTCPYCKSRDIEASGIEIDGGATAWQDIECRDCGEEWTDIYTLTAIEEIQV